MHRVKIQHFRWLLILALVGLAVWRLSSHFAILSALLALKRNVNYFWIAMAMITPVGQYFGDGWLSQILLKIINFRMNLKDTIRIAALNVFAAHFSPVGETGALVTTFYFYHKLGVDAEGIIFLSLAWGIISTTIVFAIFLVSLTFLPKIPLPIHPSILNLIILIAVVVIFGLLLANKKSFWPFFKRRFQTNQYATHFFKFFRNWKYYQKLIIAHPYLIFQAQIASVIYHFSNITTLGLAFLAFGHVPKPAILAFAYTVSLVSGWVTLAPGGIGSADAILVLILLYFKINPAQVVAAVLVYRLIVFWLPTPVALFSYLSLRKSLRGGESTDVKRGDLRRGWRPKKQV